MIHCSENEYMLREFKTEAEARSAAMIHISRKGWNPYGLDVDVYRSETEDFTICIYAYEANDRVDVREHNGKPCEFHVKRGAYIGGIMETKQLRSLEEAIKIAGRMWKENFQGTVRQAIIKVGGRHVWQRENFDTIGLNNITIG